MPAQSPTLSPTLSAITAGLRGIVLGNAGFDLADEVGADVRALGEDAAAKTREDRDERAAEREADERLYRVMQPFVHEVRRTVRGTQQKPVEAGDAEQPEPDDEHAGDRAAAERDRERFVQARARGFGRAHVRAHRHVHPDVSRKAGEDRSDGESTRGGAPQRPPDDDEQEQADDTDRQVLAIEVGLRAGLDGSGDLAHPVVAGGLRHDPSDRHDAIGDRGNGADQREDEFYRHVNLPKPCG